MLLLLEVERRVQKVQVDVQRCHVCDNKGLSIRSSVDLEAVPAASKPAAPSLPLLWGPDSEGEGIKWLQAHDHV